MIRKFTLTLSAALILTAASSCGRTVQRDGYNGGISGAAPATELATQPPSRETATEPATEAPTEKVRERIEVETKKPADYILSDTAEISGFETVLQRPELPTGCEITALTQTLNYYGFDVDKVFMCDTFMPVDINGYYSMNEAYLGDPRAENGFGCNAPVIEKAANDYFAYIGSDWYALDLTGITMDDILYQVEQGRPVIVWSTMDQRETHATFQFILGCGEEFWFNGYQHCLTVYGYDRNRGVIMAADPLVGNVEYEEERFGRIYEEMGSQAVILCGYGDTAGVNTATESEMKQWLEINKPKELENLW
ncbi:MAG: C39 family peptidase [Ruminococcus sp.]|nr:C39 family peptidase [Ruminococcus sp.]